MHIYIHYIAYTLINDPSNHLLIQLEYFSFEMNKKANQNLENDAISRNAFGFFFIECYGNAINSNLTTEEAETLFNRLDENGDNCIDGWELYNSKVSGFLSDSQIHSIVKKFKAFSKKKDDIIISKEDFIKHFPTLFNETMFQRLSHCNQTQSELAYVHKRNGIDIAFRDISLTLNVSGIRKKILESVTGRIQANTMMALMGGSGAGKTSLLNVLCGRAFYGDVAGSIMINGEEGNIESIGHCVGFVPQASAIPCSQEKIYDNEL